MIDKGAERLCGEGWAGIVAGLAKGIAKTCPDAWVAIISNPVNSTVPIVAEVFKAAGAQHAPSPRHAWPGTYRRLDRMKTCAQMQMLLFLLQV